LKNRFEAAGTFSNLQVAGTEGALFGLVVFILLATIVFLAFNNRKLKKAVRELVPMLLNFSFFVTLPKIS
jgi:hypothetical protein